MTRLLWRKDDGWVNMRMPPTVDCPIEIETCRPPPLCRLLLIVPADDDPSLLNRQSEPSLQP